MNSSRDKKIASELCSIIIKINDAWRKGRFEDLEEFFHEDMVITSPDFKTGGQGRKACIESFRQFSKAVQIHEYTESDFNSLIWENTAIVHYSFDMSYSIQGENYRDKGNDVYVFSKEHGQWKAVWRTIIPEKN